MTLLRRPPPLHAFVETQDGSLTLFSERFQEACHSTTGAKAETILHYFKGCRVLERIQEYGSINILEVGFGLGVGFLTTLESLSGKGTVHFVSLELDRDLLEWFRNENPDLNLVWDENVLTGESANYKLEIICGDARVELENFMRGKNLKFHAIYQDAFSPKKNPTLWTREWFSLLKTFSTEDVILSTYSASTSIRKSLHESGWKIRSGEKFGPKRTSTRASLAGETAPEILLQMERSPVPALSDLRIDPTT